MSTIEIETKFFASARETVGKKKMMMEVEEGSTVRDLVDKVLQKYSDIDEEHIIVAVNKETSIDDRVLKPGDEVAFLPPVSGG